MIGTIDVRQIDNVLLATIANPPSALMDRAILTELAALVTRADNDPSVGAVVLTGAHPTRFLAHFDVRVILGSAEANPPLKRSVVRALLQLITTSTRFPILTRIVAKSPFAGLLGMIRNHQMLIGIEQCSAVWIAALNGDTGGGGSELALACDKRFMADGDFVIAQPEIFLGFTPGSGATQRLTRLLGRSKALHMCLNGGPLSPQEALSYGLVDRVVPKEQLLDEALAEAKRLGRRPKHAIGAIKRAINEGGSLPVMQGLQLEASEFLTSIGTAESMTAQRAYVARTKALGDVPIGDRELARHVVEHGRFE